MILVTGGTGFVGQVLIRQLLESGYEVRSLLRPSPDSPNLPRGVAINAAVTSLQDEHGLRAAMVGVDTVYHLAGDEGGGGSADLLGTDIQGARAIGTAAQEAGVKRIFFVSHLGADRASAYPVLKAKAIAEEHIRRSGVPFTILRSALVYGPGDRFTTGLARLLYAVPSVFLIPGEGVTLIQPIWVEDLATCLVWALENDTTQNQTYEVGGPEYLQFRYVLELIMAKLRVQRSVLAVPPPYLRGLTVFLESLMPNFPVSVFWLDYLATNRTCALDTVPRVFGLLPSRLSHRLEYLQGQNWRSSLWRSVFRRRRVRDTL